MLKRLTTKQTVVAITLVAAALMPEAALAQSGSNPITEGLEWIATQLTSTWARMVAIIACAVMGYMAWAQYLRVSMVLYFVLGCVFVFGASALVDTFASESVDVGGFNAAIETTDRPIA